MALLLASHVMMSGCKKKKPPVPAPQANAPTINVPETEPAAEPAAVEPEPAAPEPSKPSPTVTKPKPKPKPRSTTTARKPAPAPPAKVVIDNGVKTGAPNPALKPEISQDDIANRRFSTVQLLESAEYNLQHLKRALSADEQTMLQHVRSYIEQSRDASKAGDVTMAYNLAVKAHLMSDSLAKR